MEDITDVDYAQAKRVFIGFDTKLVEYYHHLYVQSNILLLVDVLSNFSKNLP